MRITDCHAHAFPDSLAPGAMERLVAEALWFRVQPHHDGTVAGLINSMDRAGIDRAILASVATKPHQTEKITDWSAAQVSERIAPFASIHPGFDRPEAEAERIASMGLKGIKFHPYYMACPIDDPRSVRVAKAAEAAGLAMLFHVGYDLAYPKSDVASPERLARLLDQVPKLRVSAAHLGGWECWDESLAHLAGRRVWLDTSYSLGRIEADVLAAIVEKHDENLLLFGTDSPWADAVEDLRLFRVLPISEDAKRKALCANADAFLAPPHD